MASLERSSPSMFLGQSWSNWADKVTSQEDEDAENDERSDRTSEETESEMSREKEMPHVMRLKMEDSPMFGLCPARDEFYLVVCEQCKQVVKPQALQRHIEFRHGKPPDGPLPPLPIPAPLGDASSPTCNKQIMYAHRKTGRSVSKPPSRSNSHPLFVSLPQVANSPSPDAETKRTQSVPDLITAVEPSIDISPMRELEDHLRQPHSSSPPPPHDPHIPAPDDRLLPPSEVAHIPPTDIPHIPPPHEPHIPSLHNPHIPTSHDRHIPLESPSSQCASRSRTPSSNRDVLSAPSSPVDTVLLDSSSLSGIASFQSLQTPELSQELSIEVPSHDESLINRIVPSVDTNYVGDNVEVVLASPPVQTMPVPLTSAENLSTALSTPHIISLPLNDTLPQIQLQSEPSNLVQISRPGTTNYTPVKPRPVAITPTPTPPPAPSVTPPTPKASSRKKKVNTVKSDKNVPCKDRRYDPDKHCGVWIEEDKRQCTRSLTCKTHSLSLRRAVQGRRLPFNELLADHKARSQALAAAKAAAAAGTTPATLATTATSTTTTVVSNNLSNTTGGTSVSSKSNKKEVLSPQNLGGSPTVPVLHGPGPTPVIINSSSHPLKRSLSGSTPPSSIHLTPDDASPTSSVVVVPPDTSQTPTPLRQQEHHPSPTHQRVPSQGGEGKETGDRLDSPCTHHHPRPFAMCTYGSKRTEQGMVVLNRRQDRLRAALAGLVERQLKPPPLKKVCHSQESSVVPNLAKSGSNITSVPPKLTNSHLDQGLLHTAVPNAKPSKSSSSKSKKSKASRSEKSGDGGFSQQVKNSKVRRKSGSGASGGISPAVVQTSSSSNIVHNIFAVSSSSNVPLAIAPTTYTVVGGNGLQPVDMINVDNNTSVADMQGQLLKNLRFVVTNIEPNANNPSGTSQPAITLPILNAVANPPMVIGNIGALQLHDGKMNIKSRTKNASSKGLERQTSRTRKPSGSGVVHCSPQQTVQIGTVQGDTIVVDQGVIPSMRSSPSPVLRPESASPQLTSLPNGIIPSPSGTALYSGNKVYTGGSAPNAVVGVGASGGVVMVDQHHPQHHPQHQHHHQQQQQQQQLTPQQQPPPLHHQPQGDILSTSPSGTSTPSPGGNSTETSPSGSFQYSSGIQNLSASKSLSSSNSSKSSSGMRKGQQNSKSSNVSMSGGPAAHTNQHQTTSVQPIPFQVPLQHIMANLIDAQGKSLSAIIPANHQLFSSIQLQQGGGGAPAATPGAPVMQGGVATFTPGDKASSPPTAAAAAASILAQQPIALSLQQQATLHHHHHHQAGNQPIRLQGAGLATVASVGEHTAQVVLSPSGPGDPRQELQLHH